VSGVAFYPLEGYFALLVDVQKAPPQVFIGFLTKVCLIDAKLLKLEVVVGQGEWPCAGKGLRRLLLAQ
jgi:hypothetical protein